MRKEYRLLACSLPFPLPSQPQEDRGYWDMGRPFFWARDFREPTPQKGQF